MKTRHAATRGLTLIELLVAIALALVVLLAAAELLTSSSRSASDLQGRNELLEEMQIAQNYVAARVREAVYVFPRGTTLDLGGGETTQRPGGGNWVVGDSAAPILAFVAPPRLAGAACDPPGTKKRRTEGCYTFYAYYPVKRSDFVKGVTNSNNPGEDSQNADRWVLIEYRLHYAGAPTSVAALMLPPVSGRPGYLLLDYVQPSALAPSGTPPLFVQQDPGSAQTPGSVRVDLNFALSRRVGGKVINVPARNGDTPPEETVQSVSVSPRNLGRLGP